MRGVVRGGRRSKLSPRYMGPYRVIEKIKPAAFRLELPAELGHMHDVFHISQLKPFVESSADQIPTVPSGDVALAEDLTYDARPIHIVDMQMRQLRSRVVPQVYVEWDNGSICIQDSWELEVDMRERYHQLFEQGETS